MVYTAWRWRWCWRGWAFVWFARQRYPPLLSRCFCEHNFQGGLSIRNEFTACSVDLLGFASGFDAMIQLSRCRMNCLSMVRFCCRPMKLPIILSVDSSHTDRQVLARGTCEEHCHLLRAIHTRPRSYQFFDFAQLLSQISTS